MLAQIDPLLWNSESPILYYTCQTWVLLILNSNQKCVLLKKAKIEELVTLSSVEFGSIFDWFLLLLPRILVYIDVGDKSA